ncbi:MAG: hypothetical protein A3B86_04170 [Candidatus Yanofskybacteria bacterium RIFCSPHIGHO2_02_FULL_38_22b]|uniref:THIF-type NAD/FAD binding fold domain-containing protein n=1 Tax=Candidatus Yanofskybacteria bacterium RIFCSPHIGHO2_02_FULL_38_22b TaxID=1802673 RepID=A0A1F8F224_9BACT|nr:MAG: hypothetical protein A2816_01940 [Candidatus Yanofskybacteria bacterium RIFCSPHIGHO2_01_FULL_39_44]OGN06286.1 MAG: hypothetical protein A3B86_04170 [Candidatus Yanofskybacteria bacterium RIFCSPHIGHO2_02_FULL_38_22b]OGN19706.1 MAG: hypothetical protein A2910_03905 [Candidatus Yanofskybacteria bacterium RIFCSPLOWO2_01_FULL_39_28]
MIISSPKFFKKESKLPKGVKKIYAFQGCLEELFFINNPRWKKGMSEARRPLAEFIKSNNDQGLWVYYPWSNVAVHIVREDLYFKLRTTRNRNLITSKEQNRYRQMKVGIAGLSVGSGIVSALVISGGPKTIKIADFDVVEVSNLNRIRARLEDMGGSKVQVVAQQIWELDPFADVYIWDKGITKENFKKFITGDPCLDVFIDEMDSLDLKILARIICREKGIPVIMATDNGDTVILDVERFDLESQRQLFHGLAGNLGLNNCKNMTREKWLRLSTKIIGSGFMTLELQNSILQIGASLGGVPQLGTTASVAGAAVSFVIRRIANGYKMPSGRYIISLEQNIIPGYNNRREVKNRLYKTRSFKKKLGL